MNIVSVRQMREIETEANDLGISYDLMMQTAGNGLAKLVYDRYPLERQQGILGLIGSGNNGGDTLVALTWLAEQGLETSAYLVNNNRNPLDPLIARLQENGGKVFFNAGDPDFHQLSILIKDNALLLDGVLGTGIKLPLRPQINQILLKTNEFISLFNPTIVIIAVDCPSGIDCDTGEASTEVLIAHLTVTMAAIKQGLLKFPAFNYVGELEVVGIGLPKGENQLESWRSIHRFVPDNNIIRSFIPSRPKNAHKGTFGTAVIVAGSSNYPGAALLAATSAYRVGAGLVTVAVPKSIQPALAGQLPEATWIHLPDENGCISEKAVGTLLKNLKRASAILIGPGFNIKPTTQHFLQKFLQYFHGNNEETNDRNYPHLVIDADGLKLLSKIDSWQSLLPDFSILTPHPGEMAVLTGLSINEIQEDRIAFAEKYSSLWKKVIVLKGAFTVIAAPEHLTAVIPIATPALARAGTGDVLAGLITGLRSQGIGAYESAVAGAWIHGNAGLVAQEEIGNSASVLAGDVIRSCIKVISNIERE